MSPSIPHPLGATPPPAGGNPAPPPPQATPPAPGPHHPAPAPPAPTARPRPPARDRVICGFATRGPPRLPPGVPPALRGPSAGLAHPAVLDHLQGLGATTLNPMPVQHRADESRLLALG